MGQASVQWVSIFEKDFNMEKIHIISLNFRESPFFLPELGQNTSLNF